MVLKWWSSLLVKNIHCHRAVDNSIPQPGCHSGLIKLELLHVQTIPLLEQFERKEKRVNTDDTDRGILHDQVLVLPESSSSSLWLSSSSSSSWQTIELISKSISSLVWHGLGHHHGHKNHQSWWLVISHDRGHGLVNFHHSWSCSTFIHHGGYQSWSSSWLVIIHSQVLILSRQLWPFIWKRSWPGTWIINYSYVAVNYK